MADEKKKARDPDVDAKITPEDVEKMLLLIDQPEGGPDLWFPVANVVDFRKFLNGYGDDNPLYWDQSYGEGTRWRSAMASPMMMITMAHDEGGKISPELREKTRGALRGINMFQSGFEFEFYGPVFPGDEIHSRSYISDVIEKASEFANKSLLVKHATSFANQRGEDVGVYRYLMIHAERGTAAKKGAKMHYEPAQYTDEDIAKIDEAYANEQRRGAEPRYWEEVEEGEDLPVMVKGPMGVLELIGWHIAMGMGGFGINPSRLNYLNRERMPRFYTKGRYGFPEPVQRMHWDEDWAKKVGAPMSYDYGMMRCAWTINYYTNWMGDDGWLWKMECEMRKFNFHGDVQWFRGRVLRKYQEGPHHCIDIESWGESQRGEVTTPGMGTIILPSRKDGPVRLPRAPGQWEAEAALKRA